MRRLNSPATVISDDFIIFTLTPWNVIDDFIKKLRFSYFSNLERSFLHKICPNTQRNHVVQRFPPTFNSQIQYRHSTESSQHHHDHFRQRWPLWSGSDHLRCLEAGGWYHQRSNLYRSRVLLHCWHCIGSTAAQLQSELTKQRNAQQVDQSLGSKVATDPSSVTAKDAQTLHRRESRALGGQQPRPDSLASQAQSLAAKNEQGAPVSNQSNSGFTDPPVQSQLDRQNNYEDAADMVKQKLEQNPEAVTTEDGNLMHSRETKAFGTAEKGGLASQAQSQASKNEQWGV